LRAGGVTVRKFIFSVTLFLIPIISIALGLEFLLREIPNVYRSKKQYLDEHANEIEVLFLGSSHALYGINPEVLEIRSFNASHSSQTFFFDLKIFEKYRDNYANLKAVIIPVSYFSYFYSLLEDMTQLHSLRNYRLYYNLQFPFRLESYSEILSIKFDSNVERILDYYIKGKNPPTSTSLGFWDFEKDSQDRRDLCQTGIERAEGHTRISSYDFFEENYKALVTIIEYCKTNNILVLLYTPPGYKSYRENLNMEQLELMYETTYDIVEKYENCSYVDYLADSDFSADDFYDGDHLNEQGARKLTKKLYSSLKTLSGDIDSSTNN
jgi:hypothetical protein